MKTKLYTVVLIFFFFSTASSVLASQIHGQPTCTTQCDLNQMGQPGPPKTRKSIASDTTPDFIIQEINKQATRLGAINDFFTMYLSDSSYLYNSKSYHFLTPQLLQQCGILGLQVESATAMWYQLRAQNLTDNANLNKVLQAVKRFLDENSIKSSPIQTVIDSITEEQLNSQVEALLLQRVSNLIMLKYIHEKTRGYEVLSHCYNAARQLSALEYNLLARIKNTEDGTSFSPFPTPQITIPYARLTPETIIQSVNVKAAAVCEANEAVCGRISSADCSNIASCVSLGDYGYIPFDNICSLEASMAAGISMIQVDMNACEAAPLPPLPPLSPPTCDSNSFVCGRLPSADCAGQASCRALGDHAYVLFENQSALDAFATGNSIYPTDVAACEAAGILICNANCGPVCAPIQIAPCESGNITDCPGSYEYTTYPDDCAWKEASNADASVGAKVDLNLCTPPPTPTPTPPPPPTPPKGGGGGGGGGASIIGFGVAGLIAACLTVDDMCKFKKIPEPGPGPIPGPIPGPGPGPIPGTDLPMFEYLTSSRHKEVRHKIITAFSRYTNVRDDLTNQQNINFLHVLASAAWYITKDLKDDLYRFLDSAYTTKFNDVDDLTAFTGKSFAANSAKKKNQEALLALTQSIPKSEVESIKQYYIGLKCVKSGEYRPHLKLDYPCSCQPTQNNPNTCYAPPEPFKPLFLSLSEFNIDKLTEVWGQLRKIFIDEPKAYIYPKWDSGIPDTDTPAHRNSHYVYTFLNNLITEDPNSAYSFLDRIKGVPLFIHRNKGMSPQK